MIRKYVAALCLPVLFLAACEKEVNLKIPAYTPKLTIVAEQSLGDTIEVSIGKTASISERKNNPVLGITNATVKLYVDGVFAQNMVYDTGALKYRSAVAAEAGKKYMVKVTAPGYNEASAEVMVPSLVAIASIKHVVNARTGEGNNQQDEITVTFNDPAAPGDYYMMAVTGYDSSIYNIPGGPGGPNTSYSFSFCVNTVDASVETPANDDIDLTTCIESEHIFFRDELFNGGQKQLKFYVDSRFMRPVVYQGDTLIPYVTLTHLSEAYFRYKKSELVARGANDDPFSEPANVYSNITNGYGIFGFSSLQVAEIR